MNFKKLLSNNQKMHLYLVVSLLLLFIFELYVERALASYGIITTLKNNLAGSGEVISVFNHANGVYYVGLNIFQVRLISSITNEDTAVVGTGACCYGGDGGPALSATMQYAHDVYVTASGEIYFTESNSFRIRFVNAAGVISTVAGTGNSGYSATPTLAINADLYNPRGLVLDKDDNVFLSDNCVIRLITRSSGMITTIAGTGATDCTFSGDGGLAVYAQINFAIYIDLDSDENIIFSDVNNQAIRRVSKETGIINSIVSGIGCPSIGLSVDRSTNDVYFSDQCYRVFKSSNNYSSGIYSPFELVAGGNGGGDRGDGGYADLAQINSDWGNIEFDSLSPSGAFLIADRYNHAIRLVKFPCDEGSEMYNGMCWCSKGYYSDNGLAPCNQCDYGSYSDALGADISACLCQAGFYSSTGYAPCDACPDGTESKMSVGATSCTCKIGYTGQGDEVPNDILVGTAGMHVGALLDLHKFYSSHIFSAPCAACPANSGTWDMYGSYYQEFQSGLQSLQYSVLQEKQGNKCLCDPNTKSASGFGPCEPCSEGSGSVTLKTNIDHYEIYCAPLNYFPSYAMSKCFCKAGYFSPDGTDGNGDCQKCPVGKSSTNVDLIIMARGGGDCGWNFNNLYDYVVTNGWYSSTMNKKCSCIRNYYKNASVTIASSGHVESSNDCIQCPEGGATTSYDGSSCTICDIGYFSPSGMTPCAKCPAGKTTNGYQQTSCSITSTYLPTASPTPSPTPSSPSITNPPLEQPTRAPLRPKKPTAHPTIKPSQASACPQGYYSSTGFSPCDKCPLGTISESSGMTVCDVCAVGYFGREGSPPCTACPPSSVSNEKRTGCLLCVGYEPGCSLSGLADTGSSGGDGDGGSSSGSISLLSGSLAVLSSKVELLDGKLRAQQSYIERYKRQRNQASALGMPSFLPSAGPTTSPTPDPTTASPTTNPCGSCYGSQWQSCGRCCNIENSCYIPGVTNFNNCNDVLPMC